MTTHKHEILQLVLLGGGHAHALALLDLIKSKPANTLITLINNNALTPYSGMLPGLIAGHYDYKEMHINLAALCERGGIRFIEQTAIALDADKQLLTFDNQQTIHYDLLSIDIGITPDSSQIDGADLYGISVKPIAGFYTQFNAFREQLKMDSSPHTIAVIGGGAGSVEIIFAVAESLRREHTTKKFTFQLITGASDILLDYPPSLRNTVKQRLKAKQINLVCNVKIQSVYETHLTGKNQHNQILNIPCNKSIWCTSANAASWLETSGLDLHEGFICVDRTLRSTSHDNVFASGDIAHFLSSPLPKAGVFAVRQGELLGKNLIRHIQQQPLINYQPQTKFLSLLACGEKYAVGSRGKWLTLSGKWVWHLKDFIDRRFMKKFSI